jgi:hypothetical protein
MGCTQREPFVLYGRTRRAAIVNRCEKKGRVLLKSSISLSSLYGKNLRTTFGDENGMLELSNIALVHISEGTVEFKKPN